MHWLKTTWNEIYGLFVDDAPFAGLIVMWLVAIWALAILHIDAEWLAVLWFAGLAILLVESATRYARRSREK